MNRGLSPHHSIPEYQWTWFCATKNARPHNIANVVRTNFQHNNVDVSPWPAVSPDIAPIEHVWDELDRRLRKRPVQPRTLAELAQALQEEWVNIPQNKIQRIITSVRRRCQAVIAAKVGIYVIKLTLYKVIH